MNKRLLIFTIEKEFSDFHALVSTGWRLMDTMPLLNVTAASQNPIMVALAQFQQESNQNFQALAAQLQQINQRLFSIENNLNPARQIALHRNFLANTPESILLPVPRSHDLELPPHFPATYSEFRRLEGQILDELLEFYGLAVGGSLDERRTRLISVTFVRY